MLEYIFQFWKKTFFEQVASLNYNELAIEIFDKLSLNHKDLLGYKNYKGDFVVTKYDVQKESVKFNEAVDKYKASKKTPFVIVGDRTFSGYNESISFYIENMIKNR